MPRGKPFVKNDPRRSNGGKRENAGRHPDWLKAQIDQIVDWKAKLKRLDAISNGVDVEQLVGDKTESAPASIKDQLRAMEMLLDRRWGKVVQSLDVTSDGRTLSVILAEAREGIDAH